MPDKNFPLSRGRFCALLTHQTFLNVGSLTFYSCRAAFVVSSRRGHRNRFNLIMLQGFNAVIVAVAKVIDRPSDLANEKEKRIM